VLKLHLYPAFRGEDKGDGGIRRVVEAQRRYLPEHGIEFTNRPAGADLVAVHIAGDDALYRRSAGLPLVVHNHGVYWAEYPWPEWCLQANAKCMEAVRRAEAITAPSEWVAQSLRRHSMRRVDVIGHGVDLDEWPFQRDHKGYVLWNKTRVDPVCDPAPLTELAALSPDVEFVSTFGDGPSNVHVTGVLPYPQGKNAVQGAAVYLCTTRETFGIGTLEAMASGVPVLGWRWAGQAEIIEHGETGWLSPLGDYDDLAAGLRYCLENRPRLAACARQVVEERYQWRDVVPQYAALYKDVLQRLSMPRPKVSVIVRAYAAEKYLPAALESVASQTSQGWECIVVDDASPDRCGEIGDAFAAQDERFRVVHNDANRHVSGAMNAGVEASRCQYVLALDADCTLPRQALQLLSNALDADRSLHIAYGNVEFLEPDGKRWHSGWPLPFSTEHQLTKRTPDGRAANLIPSNAMFRREVWELTGGYRERYRTGEDPDFWTRAVSYGFRPAMVTDQDTLVYLNRPDSVSQTEELKDWTAWMPWCHDLCLPPAAVVSAKQAPIPSLDPPRVAVIIPVGPGHENYLVDAVDSVDAQEFRDWECIVVNDTGAPLNRLPSWARVLETSGGVGPAAARNMGIAAARAPLFVPLDADDTLEVPALATMLRVYEAFGGYVYSDWNERWADRPMSVWEAPEYDATKLLKQGCLHAVTGLFAKSDWETVGGYNERLPAWEDWDFQLRLAAVAVCGIRAPWPLFTYRKDTGRRREENYAALEENKRLVRDEWSDYFDGRRELMGCGCVGRKVSAGPTLQRGAQAEPEAGDSGYLVVEYTGFRDGAASYRGPSGTTYRFSVSESRKIVKAQDAPFFDRLVEFRVLEPKAVPA